MDDKKQPKVLVIDDETGLRDMLVFGLTDRGYEVVSAANGEEAIACAQKSVFDIALCDIMMPGKGGIEVLKELKGLQPSMIVVMATGYATLETAVESMKQGAYDYIAKPYGLDQISMIFEKALEHRRLKDAVGKLEELNRLKSEFLANMSHELRTPMNAIIGYSSILLDGLYGSLTEKQRQGLGRIDNNAKSLLQLINNILDLSKLSAGRMTIFYEPCRLDEIAKEISHMMEGLVAERKIKLSVSVPEGLVVRTDKTKLKQILINLIGNGIKFTHEGGVTLSIEGKPEAHAIEIRVQDTGIGIKPGDIPQLFQEFKQLDASPTREYGGSGLGLSICKKIIELLGGTIKAESVPGLGSTFIVNLPDIQEETDASEKIQAPQKASHASGERILLAIDDDPEVLRVIADSLEGSGYRFIGTQSGDEGLALARQHKPYLITLDIMMPHRDGWSVLQSLKSDPELRTIPVFVISIVENKALAFSLGVSDYIVKPFERRDLLEKLNLFEKAKTNSVLVVDDDPAIIQVFREALMREGYEVETAMDGDEALTKMLQKKPDILLLDLMMPRVSGFDVLEMMEKHGELKGIRVLVMTAKYLTPRQAVFLEHRVEMILQKGTRAISEMLDMLKLKLVAMQEVAK